MTVPIVLEKVLRASLQCFQRGGIIPSGADISKIEQIPNNASNSDISDVLDSISFVTVGGGGGVAGNSLAAPGDVNVFVDSNNNDSPMIQPRYFRVAQDQATAPVTDQDNELLTIGAEASGLLAQAPALTVGPRISLISKDTEAFVNVGANFDLLGGSHHFGVLHGASDAVTSGSGGSNTSGLTILSEDNIGLSSANSIRISDENKNAIKGGWYDLGSAATAFHVGDWTVPDSFAIEPVSTGVGKYFYHLHTTSDSGTVPNIHLYNENAKYWSRIIIGGPYGETWADPTNYEGPTLLVTGDDSNTTSPVAYLLDRKTGRTVGSEVFTIRSDSLGGMTNYYLTRWYVGTNPVARIDDGGDMSILGTYSTGAGDVAELVETDQEYEPGTVLVLRNGICVASDNYSQSNVVGVVSTKPGVLMGEQNIYDAENEFELDFLSVVGDTVELPGHYSKDLLGTYLRYSTHFVEIAEIAEVTGPSNGPFTVVTLKEDIELGENEPLYAGINMPRYVAELGLCGKMPVWCSTEMGDITGNGETLVTGPDGCAVVSSDPKPGTIIGKAVGKLIQTDDSIVKGKVEVLVNLQ